MSSEMLDKMKDLLEQGIGTESELAEPKIDPLVEAVDRAIFSLSEIAIYSSYGRSNESAREANEALEAIKALKEKYDEQQKLMDILSGRKVEGELDDELGGYA